MPEPSLTITLISASGEVPSEDQESLQREFEELPLHQTVLKPVSKSDGLVRLGSPFHLPTSSLEWVRVALTPLATALGAWLHAHYGGKVRIKVGDIEAEARTVEELESVLAKAQEIKESTEAKRVIP